VQLEEVVTVHKKHTSALEKALRCLDNDAITSEEIDPLKDDLDYYIVSGVTMGCVVVLCCLQEHITSSGAFWCYLLASGSPVGHFRRAVAVSRALSGRNALLCVLTRCITALLYVH
jgi:hypothetical protein